MTKFITTLVRAQRYPWLGRLAQQVLALHGIEIPRTIAVPRTVKFPHRGHGTVIHPLVIIGDHVTIYQGVTIGRADSWNPRPLGHDPLVTLGDHAVICPKATILFREAPIVIAEGTVIGANAVLTKSTGPWEIWAGNPARLISTRRDRPRE